MKDQKRKRIVILGAGFGGVYTAEHLEKLLGGRDDFEIIIVNKENYFVFQPKGDLGDRIYIIVNGRAEVVREENGRESMLAELMAGEYFGEMALLNKTARNATVRCVAPMDVLSLPKREFNLLAANLPELRQSFEGVMQRRGGVATHAR